MRIKKHSNLLAVLALVLLVVVSLGFAQILSFSNLEKNVEQRSLIEASERVTSISNDFNHSLSLQFETMETLAKHLGTQESLETDGCKQLMRSFLTVNRFCTVAYTNKNGDILSAVSADDNVPAGNISDRPYFQNAIYWKDARAIQYMNKTALTDDPRVLFAVPIISDDTIVGCLFASTEQDFFESKVFSSNDYDGFNVFLIDTNGTIIADPANKGLLQNGYNIFESMLSESDVENIKQDFSASLDGAISTEGKQTSYLAYSDTGINGWRMTACIDKQTAMDKYSGNMKVVSQTVLLISSIFVICMVLIFFICLFLEKQKNKNVKELEGISRNLFYFLEKSGNAAFVFDAKKVALHPSKALEEMVGNELPENWLSVTHERKKIHPEFDYDGVVRIINEVVSRKEYREICTCIKKESGDIRWLKISMTPSMDRSENYSGVVGIVTDITNAYTEEKIGFEEQSRISKSLITYIPLTISINLTQGTYSFINHDPNFCAQLPQKGSYDDLISFALSRVPEESSSTFVQTFDKERLLAAYEQGKDEIEYEHPFIDDSDKTEKCLIAKIHFLPNKINNDVRLLFVIIDITQRKEYEALLQQNYIATITESEKRKEKQNSIGESTGSDVDDGIKSKVAIRAFGYFDLFVNGQAVPFANEKSKEMLAVLVDRKGGFVSSSEMISYLWEDEPFDKKTQTRCRQVASRLKKALDDNGIGDIIENVNGKRRIIPDKVDCDYFKYLSNKKEHHRLYNGSYMMNYSWGEMTIAELESDRTIE